MKWFKKLMESGIWLIIITFIMTMNEWYGGIPPNKRITLDDVYCIVLITLIPFAIFWIKKSSDLKKMNVRKVDHDAKYPQPPPELVYDLPTGFCFGQYNGKYVCKKVDEPGSILVQGGSGTGKSTTIIQSFLLNPVNKESCCCLVLDPKHELTDNCVLPDEVFGPDNPTGNTIILDPLDRTYGYGYDPFFSIDERSSESEVHNVMEVVADSIIPTIKGDAQVWSLAAKQFLRGALTYFYKYEQIKTLPDIITTIKSSPIKDIVERIIGGSIPGNAAYTDIISFHDMADETLTSMDMNLSQRIVQFSTSQDLAWCLGANPRKCNPSDLLNKNIYLCIPEDKILQWSQLVLLVFNQAFTWMMGLPEKKQDPARKNLAMILDETVALLAGLEAPMPLLSQVLRIGARSKGCTVLVCVQSISGLYDQMGKEQTKDMVSNMAYKLILGSEDYDTSKEIKGWIGKYMRRSVSSSSSGKQEQYSVKYEEDDIINEDELNRLSKDNEVVLITSNHGYMRLKKVFTFEDKYFEPLLNKVEEVKKGIKHDKE